MLSVCDTFSHGIVSSFEVNDQNWLDHRVSVAFLISSRTSLKKKKENEKGTNTGVTPRAQMEIKL